MKWLSFVLILIFLVACQPNETTISLLQVAEEAQIGGEHPTLKDFWEGRAEFKLTVTDTGLPMGESETIIMENGHFWSFVHASDRSAGTLDQCGDPVEFPGCTVIYYSTDEGETFQHEDPPVCQFQCNQCPCSADYDHIDQQQYPDVHYANGVLNLVYEFRGTTQMRTSTDGHNWSTPTHVGDTGIWTLADKPCPPYERIGSHPFVPHYYECLSGAPPGIYVDGETVYVFAGMGQAPGGMGCYKGHISQPANEFVRCDRNPLFSSASEYGPIELRGKEANAFWDFRTISSAETIAIGHGSERRYYMLFEGLRGPGPGDPGDTQFGLGLARSRTAAIDGAWEQYDGNPILVDLPSNIGIGHADIIVHEGQTILYTSLDGVVRSRLDLVWKAPDPLDSPLPQFQPDAVAQQGGVYPTMQDLWDGKARFALDVANTHLPMGESETVILPNGEWWSYVHASDRSAGTIDQCGDPVEFPGCTVVYRSEDEGRTFAHDGPPVCEFACLQCPCQSEVDHVDQQQYPDVFFSDETLFLVYEYRGNTKMRTSADGINWTPASHVGETGHWRRDFRDCSTYESIGEHPFVPYDYECLAGAPPGMYVEGDTVYVFVAMGQAPGNMGCYKGDIGEDASKFDRCDNNPLFTGATEYGPLELRGKEANAFWDFRTISSAEIYPLDTQDGRRYFMVYEGLRGPGPGDPGDTQFGLGLARSLTDAIDGAWEEYPHNPILLDLPANIGLGHADFVVYEGETFLYTSLDGTTRSRLRLVWR